MKVPNFLNFQLSSLATTIYGSFSGPYARILWPVCLNQIWTGSLFSLKSYHSSPKFRSIADPFSPVCRIAKMRFLLRAPTDPISWILMHIISCYCGNEHHPPTAHPPQTDKHTDRTEYNTLRRQQAYSVNSGVARILCQGAQVCHCEKTENNKCMSYHTRHHYLLLTMR